ncbi:MAG: NAD+ synthase [Actinomycetota bacterium]
MRIALAQINPTVGDVEGNASRVIELAREASDRGAQAVAFPELAITGYPPEDLVLKRGFVKANQEALDEIAASTGDSLVIVGFADPENGKLYNAAALCHGGRIVGTYHKQLLPNYGVFDERRYFQPGREHVLVETEHGVLGVCVCEDAWHPSGPVVAQGDAGAQIVVNINASPYHKGKLREREQLLGERAERARASIVYVNAVGGQDELVFDGSSLVVSPDGDVVARLPQFEETLEIVDVPLGETTGSSAAMRRISVELPEARGELAPVLAEPLGAEEEIYRALALAVHDYVRKNRFEKVVVGLSGGIDSSLTATIAADALGPDDVLVVAMPSEFSSTHSTEDAKELASNLDLELIEIPIAQTHRAYMKTLEEVFGLTEPGIAEENLQARIRGNLLMAVSNRYGHLVLTTGNKSEMACGYATLYGDMAGGFAVLKDVFKTEVYALARYRNSLSRVIPESVLTKAPSAELRPNQKDEDSLPPYERLDPILEAYIERNEGVSEIVETGHDRDTVTRVIALVDRAEYKRRQAPPGPKVTVMAFGRDRRLPITNRWREAQAPMPARVVGERGPE